jgi:hypothetical protein
MGLHHDHSLQSLSLLLPIQTPLVVAAIYNSLPLVQFLHANGALIEVGPCSALYAAAASDTEDFGVAHDRVVEYLLMRKAVVDFIMEVVSLYRYPIIRLHVLVRLCARVVSS